jgi:NAD(P)-dependent dehydrogenase (short-subunit alcohol dehydrogenase family)
LTLLDLRRRIAVALLGAFASGVAIVSHADTVFITGANSGIGLEFSKQYAARGWTVIATHRRAETPESLAALSERFEQVLVERMDVTDHASIDALAAKLADMPIDLLINNAGITGDFTKPTPQSFGTLAHEQFDSFMRTNALGPVKVTEAFRSNVIASQGKKVVAISSLAGSFGAGSGGMPGGYWYKASKAALNMFMLNVARDLKPEGVVVALLSPGTVRVEKIADARFPGLLEPEDSIAGMIKVIDSLTLNDAGSFLRYNGEPQPF